ncbi:MAG: hypothetical protein AAGK97_13320 [Bacteroidota bacterium]
MKSWIKQIKGVFILSVMMIVYIAVHLVGFYDKFSSRKSFWTTVIIIYMVLMFLFYLVGEYDEDA